MGTYSSFSNRICLIATRKAFGYVDPKERARCGTCVSCHRHVTEDFVKTNTHDCRRYSVAVKVDGWCPSYRARAEEAACSHG